MRDLFLAAAITAFALVVSSAQAATYNYAINGLAVATKYNVTAFLSDTTVFDVGEVVNLSFTLDDTATCAYAFGFPSFEADCGIVTVTATNSSESKSEVYSLTAKALEIAPNSFFLLGSNGNGFEFYNDTVTNGALDNTTMHDIVTPYLGGLSMYPAGFGDLNRGHTFSGSGSLQFLLKQPDTTPVPIAAPAVLLAAGLAGLAALRRRSGESTPAV